MASPIASQSPTAAQTGQPNTPSSSKRAPDEEVQFVSSKPVKKRRTSLPSGKVTAPQQLEASQPKPPQELSKSQLDAPQAPSNHENGGESKSSIETPIIAPGFLQGSLVPAMECFTFPQASSLVADMQAPSSPALSPRQLPQDATSTYPTAVSSQNNMDLMPFPELFNSTLLEGFGGPWDLANWVAQPAMMTPEAALNQRMLNPPSHLQPDTQALGPPSDYSMTMPSPLPLSQPCPVPSTSAGNTSSTVQGTETEQSRQQTPQKKEESPQPVKESTPVPSCVDNKSQTPVTAAAQVTHTSGTEKETTPQPREAPIGKAPCLICAKLRQQAMVNQNNAGHLAPVAAGTANEHHLHAHPPHPSPSIGPNHGCMPGPNPHLRFQYLNSPMNMVYGSGGAAGPALRPVAPYVLGSVLSQPPMSSNTHMMAAPQLQYTVVPNVQQSQGKQRQPPLSAKKTAGCSTPAGKSHASVASKRKPPPNLIVDVAETCEEVFPFDEVAERHSVPRHKVVEVFSAIVQLPLLRCATDKRRAGKLAQTRMKEFAKAKKDSQAANTAGAQGKRDTTPAALQEKGPILPGVMELAKNMPPMEYPGNLTHGFTGPW